MSIRCPKPPSGKLPPLRLRPIEPNRRLFRVGCNAYPIDAWDDRREANSRFSPLVNAAGELIPVSYLGSTPDVALLETVLRFTPAGGGGRVPRARFRDRCLAEVQTTRSLQLVPLCGPEARLLGENVAVAISNAFAQDYSRTQQWAARLFEAFPMADGIEWISHQEGRHTAIMLWQRDLKETSAPFELRDPATGLVAIESRIVMNQLHRLVELTGHTLDDEEIRLSRRT